MPPGNSIGRALDFDSKLPYQLLVVILLYELRSQAVKARNKAIRG